MSKGCRMILLCEDKQHEVFARHYFLNKGFQPHQIRSVVAPERKNAEQFIRRTYPEEVKRYRNTQYRLAICLVVMTDADKYSVEERLRQLDQTLADSGQEKRQSNESIAIFVPKWAIETWIHYLMGDAIPEDEQTVMKDKFKNNQAVCKPYVKKLATEICPKGLPADAPSSLHAACDELKRIPSKS